MSQIEKHKAPDEIDLGLLIKKIKDFFNNCVKLFFRVLLFFKKYATVVVILILIGFGYGFYLDVTKNKTYTNEVIVIPNVESVDYLYSKINALNAKIKIKDSIYLKTILDTNHRRLREIKIEPIVDIYNFVSKSRDHIDIFRILFQNQDLKEYLDDLATTKYFKYHRVNFSIVGTQASEKIIEDILREINENEHYQEYLEVGKENTKFQIEQTHAMIKQVDSIIKSTTDFASQNQSNQSVYINDNSQLTGLLNIKRDLLDDLRILEMKSKDEVQIVKAVSSNYNIVGKKGFPIANKIKFPILLVFLFSFVFFLIYLYRKLKAIAEDD
jgi:hypothetical protein